MNIFFSQIYIRPGIDYPFSHLFQKWLSARITELVQPSAQFIKTYGVDYELIFNISAKAEILEPEIKGPTVFKRDKDVEFTIFLPHKGSKVTNQIEYADALKHLLNGVVTVLKSFHIDTLQLVENSSNLIERVISDPTMIEKE